MKQFLGSVERFSVDIMQFLSDVVSVTRLKKLLIFHLDM